MSKAKTQSKSERLEQKYDGITVSDYWHDNGEISFLLANKETVLSFYEQLPVMHNNCRKIGITNKGYVAYKNPIGNVVFFPISVYPNEIKVSQKTWYVTDSYVSDSHSHKKHPVGEMWYNSPN